MTRDHTTQRIAKMMAHAGLCSRRDAEQWIADGRVKVNGVVITSPALNVTDTDAVMVDNQSITAKGLDDIVLYRYHKPSGLVTTHKDDQGRETVFDALPKNLPRLISVGRLDLNTEGLLLLTNNGDLSRHLEHPSTGWTRRYKVRAYGRIGQERLDALKNGVTIDGVKYAPIRATLEKQQGDNAWMEFALTEGKNREIRNVCEYLGLQVNRLIRLSYGPFQLGNLPKGEVEQVKGKIMKEQVSDFFKK